MARATTKLADREELSIALDIYLPLLTAPQRKALKLHVEHDLSLAEAAVKLKVSRQSVHEHVQAGLATIRHLEDRLKLVDRYRANRKRLEEISARIRKMRCPMSGSLSCAHGLAGQIDRVLANL